MGSVSSQNLTYNANSGNRTVAADGEGGALADNQIEKFNWPEKEAWHKHTASEIIRST